MSHYIDGETVKLNLEDMLDVCGSAVRNAKEQMEKYQDEVTRELLSKGEYKYIHASMYARELLKHTQEYAAALELYNALHCTKERQNVSIEK